MAAISRQGKGHTIMEKQGHPATLAIPNHKTVLRALLAGLLKDAGVSESEYIAAYKGKAAR